MYKLKLIQLNMEPIKCLEENHLMKQASSDMLFERGELFIR